MLRIGTHNFLNIFRQTLICLLLISGHWIHAQQQMLVSGSVVDSTSGEPLAMATFYITGTENGIITDSLGYFSTKFNTQNVSLTFSYIGYEDKVIVLEGEGPYELKIALSASGQRLREVTISSGRYRNKNNPAVDLVKMVIDKAASNRKEALNFYSYDRYEKMELDLTHIHATKLFSTKLKSMRFVLDHIDSSEFAQSTVLPFYMRETNSSFYYRKEPKHLSEIQHAVKRTELKKYLDNKGISDYVNSLFTPIDVYEPKIKIITNYFISPLANMAPAYYRYYLEDTVEINGISCVALAFFPRNKTDLCFIGHLYIVNDGSYAVYKVKLEIPKEINLNFTKAIKIEQDYSSFGDSVRLLTYEKVSIDLHLNPTGKQGILGEKTTFISDYSFAEHTDPAIYNDSAPAVDVVASNAKSEGYWEIARPIALTDREKGAYQLIDSVQGVDAFKKGLDISFILISGYFTSGNWDIGPVTAWGAYNPIEGFRTRLGGMTNLHFNKRIFLDGYLAYGFKDQKLKYMGSVGYSFNTNFLQNPRHFIQAAYQHDVIFPGQVTDFYTEDGIVMSFRRGNPTQMLMNTSAKLQYVSEYKNGFSYQLQVENRNQSALGSLSFKTNVGNSTEYISDINTSEASVRLRFAPHEQYYQGKIIRARINSEYPVFTLKYTQGISGVFGSGYEYQKLNLQISKRLHISPLGYTILNLEASKLWGEVPYPLLLLPRANQSYFYQSGAYNMMNFLEFASDAFVGLNAEHYFNGLIFNKIPLFKQLKLREVLSFKILYGSLSDANNPNINNSEQIQFPEDTEGNPTTFTLQNTPYMEVGFGISNIFKVLRIDLVRRLTYVNNPEVPTLWGVQGLGLRGTLQLEF